MLPARSFFELKLAVANEGQRPGNSERITNCFNWTHFTTFISTILIWIKQKKNCTVKQLQWYLK